jgi:hypothetical protein
MPRNNRSQYNRKSSRILIKIPPFPTGICRNAREKKEMDKKRETRNGRRAETMEPKRAASHGN